VVQAVYATGEVEPVDWAKVSPLESGRITEILAREGDAVQRGAVLARLDDRTQQAELEELVAREAFLQEDLRRLAVLLDKSHISRQAYDRAESELKQNRAAIAAAEQHIRDMRLQAPLDGTVLRRDGEIGETVTPDDVLFWVGKPQPLRITAEIDEEDIPLVRTGQDALIKADAYPGRVLHGTVGEITPMGDPVNKNYRVRVTLPKDTPLLIGMTTEINVVVRTEDAALTIPIAALVDRPDGGRAAWTVIDGAARRRDLEVGVLDADRAEVLDGLEEDALVIVAPPDGLTDGAAVRAKTPDA
jgi:RND family efflux transporter MFP subunit